LHVCIQEMGNYIAFNTTSVDVYIEKDDAKDPHVVILHDYIQGINFAPNSKYKVKKVKNHKLIAKFWTDENGWIKEFKNYANHVFIKVEFSKLNDTLGIPESMKAKTLKFKETRDFVIQYIPTFFICKRVEEEEIPLPV
jgi:hypothetical protein